MSTLAIVDRFVRSEIAISGGETTPFSDYSWNKLFQDIADSLNPAVDPMAPTGLETANIKPASIRGQNIDDGEINAAKIVNLCIDGTHIADYEINQEHFNFPTAIPPGGLENPIDEAKFNLVQGLANGPMTCLTLDNQADADLQAVQIAANRIVIDTGLGLIDYTGTINFNTSLFGDPGYNDANRIAVMLATNNFYGPTSLSIYGVNHENLLATSFDYRVKAFSADLLEFSLFWFAIGTRPI
jgi:hypothetical protein